MPHQSTKRSRTSSTRRRAPVIVCFDDPATRGISYVSRRRPHAVQRETVPVGEDRLHRDGVSGGDGERLDIRLREVARSHAGRANPFRHRLEAYDLAHTRGRGDAELGRGDETATADAGVDQQVRKAGGAEHPYDHLVRAEFRAPSEIVAHRHTRRKVQHRCTPAAYGQAQWRVRVGNTGRRGSGGLGQQEFEVVASG